MEASSWQARLLELQSQEEVSQREEAGSTGEKKCLEVSKSPRPWYLIIGTIGGETNEA